MFDTVDRGSGTADHDGPRQPNAREDLLVVNAEGRWTILEQLARSLHLGSADLDATLQAIVHGAVRTVAGTDDAGLILVEHGELRPVVTTGERPARLDDLQRTLRLGPCFEAAATQSVIVVADLRTDARWPELREMARELSVVSMVCVPLYVQERTTGALSLYSSGAALFDDADLAWTQLFATHAALALADAQQAEQLRTALATRDVLGQAKGILMERLHLSSDEAFAMLVTASQTTNLKVTVVAEHLVSTGELLTAGMRPRY